MKQTLFAWISIAGVSTALTLVAPAAAVAGSGFSASDLSGEYVFHLTEIRTEYDYSSGVPVAVTDYCDQAGTLNFDGVSTMIVSETRRCSFTGTFPATTATLNYSVAPDGSVSITDPAEPIPDPVHGQIVNRGKGILVDGTTRTNPNVLIFHGEAIKR